MNRTLNKRIKTNEDGIFYKEIINDKKKVVDKIFLIRYRHDDADKLLTIGKYSQGIRINYCKEKRNEILNNIRLGETPTTIRAKRIKKQLTIFETIANNYFEYASIHNRDYLNTQSRYENHIKNYIGNKDINRITPHNIEDIQRDKIQILAPKTVNHIIQTIGTIFNFAIDRGNFKGENPIKKIKPLKVNNARERFLSIQEVKQLIKEVEKDEELLLFVKLSLSTGGRFQTINQIKKKDVNLEQLIITLEDFKNNSFYKGFLQKEIMPLLKNRLLQIESNDYVVNYKGTKDLKSKIYKKLKPILDKLFNKGLDATDRKNRVVVHTLRHTFASHLAINGTPIYTIQKLMNHRDINMTMRYAKLAPDSGKDAVLKLYF